MYNKVHQKKPRSDSSIDHKTKAVDKAKTYIKAEKNWNKASKGKKDQGLLYKTADWW